MELISRADLIRAANLQKFGFLKGPIAELLMKAAKIDKVNVFYSKLAHKKHEDFFSAFIEELDLKYVVFKEDLARIPKTGPFIIVANHPLGAIDGVLMTSILSQIRPDFKIMGNFLLTHIAPMKPYVIAVNPFEEKKEVYSSTKGLRESLRHLKEGGCLGIFPAGEVSNMNHTYGQVQDRPWDGSVLKFIRKAHVPVIPMYFNAKNSPLFYQLARIHPNLQTLLLPSEMLRKRDKPIRIRIGRPISTKLLDQEENLQEFGDLIQKRIKLLSSYYDRRKTLMQLMNLRNLKLNLPLPLLHRENIVHNIIDPTPVSELQADISALKQKGSMLFGNGNYEVYFAKYEEIPAIMREIGRQREITFRAVGEGSNLPFDLDAYDRDYCHLFLWDSAEEKLVGAYRLALGRQIMKNHGIQGFYTSSLFDFDQELHPFFKKVIEMGRAYISQDYQQKPLPLFLLWKGIVHVCLRNPDHKFLMGGVSISDKFSDFSKSLMIEFMRSHYFDSAVAQYVHPKHEFKVKLNNTDKALFLNSHVSDLAVLDRIIDELEPGLRVPVLIKKYIKQNAKVISFNVDPEFNDAIDGLMYIRISDIPEDTIKPVMEEINRGMAQT